MRIATFNLENLDDGPDAAAPFADRVRLLRPQLDRFDADVLCLQEVNAQKIDPAKAAPRRFRALGALLAGTPYAGFARAATTLRDGRGPLDVQNLVILSRLPIRAFRQYWHDLVPPPAWAPGTAPAAPVAWDRPILHAELALADGRALHVLDLHLRAPLAAFIAGEKSGPFTWKTTASWAAGFYLATMKRAGQALEARLAVDRLLDADPDALVVVCGDMNADVNEMPLRLLRAETEDTANGALAARVLVPLERAVAESRRFSVLHAGRRLMLDHVLASRALMGAFRGVEIHNEALEDEVVGYALAGGSPETYHAPVVVTFDLPVQP
ncbi:MAG: endonuclease [Alphaproteobacteria bacterium]|nr:endonuclease [Alphaproteobacteria bacterium]